MLLYQSQVSESCEKYLSFNSGKNSCNYFILHSFINVPVIILYCVYRRGGFVEAG